MADFIYVMTNVMNRHANLVQNYTFPLLISTYSQNNHSDFLGLIWNVSLLGTSFLKLCSSPNHIAIHNGNMTVKLL